MKKRILIWSGVYFGVGIAGFLLAMIVGLGDSPASGRFLEIFSGAFLLLYVYPVLILPHIVFPTIASPLLIVGFLGMLCFVYGVLTAFLRTKFLSTQTHRPYSIGGWSLAHNILAVILLVAFLSSIVSYIQHERELPRMSAIDACYIRFEGYLREQDFAQAYQLMSPSYRHEHTLEQFTSGYGSWFSDETLRLHPQRSLYFSGRTAWVNPKDSSQRGGILGISFEFEEIQEKWYLTGKTALTKD